MRKAAREHPQMSTLSGKTDRKHPVLVVKEAACTNGEYTPGWKESATHSEWNERILWKASQICHDVAAQQPDGE